MARSISRGGTADDAIFQSTRHVFETIDGIRELRLTEIGRRYADKDLPHKEWSRYNDLKKATQSWRDEVEKLALDHHSIAEAKQECDNLNKVVTDFTKRAEAWKSNKEKYLQKLREQETKINTLKIHFATGRKCLATMTRNTEQMLRVRSRVPHNLRSTCGATWCSVVPVAMGRLLRLAYLLDPNCRSGCHRQLQNPTLRGGRL